MKTLTLDPITKIQGEVTLPGSKSISNRVLLLSALSVGTSRIENLLSSDDVDRMSDALSVLGFDLSREDDRCLINGSGGTIPVKGADLFLGNAGTAMRPLCAALCLGEGVFTLSGVERMKQRPIGDLVDALRLIGAQIGYMENEGYPPVKIEAAGLKGGEVSIRGNISSQFLTALLMAAPLAESETTITVEGELVSKPYIDITLDLMKQFGVEVDNQNYERFVVPKVDAYSSPGEVFVEGDASSASYFLSAAAIRGGTVKVTGVGTASVQGDVAHADVLAQMGAKVVKGGNWLEVSRGDELRGVDLDLSAMPDAAMTVAATALFAKGNTRIRNVGNWRVKETDRLSAMATELRKVGATVVEGVDFIEIKAPDRIKPATIDTYDDHRMAMAMSLAALGEAEIVINDPGCVAKTFPDYFQVLESLVDE